MANPIPQRPLGGTGVSVSEICLGTGQLGWTARDSEAFRLLDTYVSAGGNFIDTADIYTAWVTGHTGGESETTVGAWMKARKNRKSLVIATKCRGRMWAGPMGEGLSRAHIVLACEDSLRRLQTDHIDLYQSHWYDDATPIEESLAAYRDLIQSGKIRFIGASNFSPARLAEALALTTGSDLPKYVCDQPYYNLLSRGYEEDREWILKRYKVGCIPYTPLAQGFLTGKYHPAGPLPKSKRAEHVRRTYFNETNWRILGLLRTLGKKRGKTVAQMALGWLLTHDWVTAPILGSSNVKQLQEDLGAAGLKLTPVEMKKIEEASKAG